MNLNKLTEALTFDDVSIIPLKSEIESRSHIDVSNQMGKFKLNIPLISSPMDTVTESTMAIAIEKLGGLGIIHRFMSPEKQCEEVKRVKEQGLIAAAAIGSNWKRESNRFAWLKMANVDILCIDVAHGHHSMTRDTIKAIRIVDPKIHIMAGNVATKEAIRDLAKWGANSIRVGIGSGSLCTTRLETGVGIPQITSIVECAAEADKHDIFIIADGGCRMPGDVAKALAAGADAVMLGGMIAGTKESPGSIFRIGSFPNETLYKIYRGSASMESKIERGEEDKNIEGTTQRTIYRGKVKRIVNHILDGVRSSMSYVGARNISEFQRKAEFVKVTNSGIVEATAHGLDRNNLKI